jgi:hypothetical protein
MTADGELVGTIDSASGNSAHVKPDTGLSRSVRQKLGWSGDDDTYRLQKSNVDKISGDEIHLKRDF